MRPCYVDVEMTFIEKISGVEQSFKADFYFTMYAQAELWTENSTLQIGSVTESEGEVTAIGGPLPEFVNGDSLEFRSRAWTLFPPNISATSIQGLSLTQLGWSPSDPANLPDKPWVYLIVRVVGFFSADLQLKDFPFDTQVLRIHIEDFNLAEDASYMRGRRVASFADRLQRNLTEWRMRNSSVLITRHDYPSFGAAWSRISFNVALQRIPDYYINKIVVGLCLLMTMNLFVLGLPIDAPDRVVGGVTIFLAIVTYLFIVSSDVPKIAYSTRLDAFVQMCMFLTTILTGYHAAMSLSDVICKRHEAALEAEEKAMMLKRQPNGSSTVDDRVSKYEDDGDRRQGKSMDPPEAPNHASSSRSGGVVLFIASAVRQRAGTADFVAATLFCAVFSITTSVILASPVPATSSFS